MHNDKKNMLQIPKTIHYCWFGKKRLPQSARKCIESWKRHFPDFRIICWNEDNFDVNAIPFTRDAYAAGKFAFVSDYARFDILHRFGGIYFDIDVEVIKPFSEILEDGPFLGFESTSQNEPPAVASGLGTGALPGMPLLAEMAEVYRNMPYTGQSGKSRPVTVVTLLSGILSAHGMHADTSVVQHVAGFSVYPADYMSPVSTVDGKLRITPNTVSIHHYAQSWQSPLRKYGRRIVLAIGGVSLKTTLKSLLFKK